MKPCSLLCKNLTRKCPEILNKFLIISYIIIIHLVCQFNSYIIIYKKCISMPNISFLRMQFCLISSMLEFWNFSPFPGSFWNLWFQFNIVNTVLEKGCWTLSLWTKGVAIIWFFQDVLLSFSEVDRVWKRFNSYKIFDTEVFLGSSVPEYDNQYDAELQFFY